jgi:signal transduction histidine kinase
MTSTAEDEPPDGWPADPQERLRRLTHDLRTPLTVVEGFADLLDRRFDGLDDAARRDYLARIAEAARELRGILDSERATRPVD